MYERTIDAETEAVAVAGALISERVEFRYKDGASSGGGHLFQVDDDKEKLDTAVEECY